MGGNKAHEQADTSLCPQWEVVNRQVGGLLLCTPAQSTMTVENGSKAESVQPDQFAKGTSDLNRGRCKAHQKLAVR